MAKYQFSGHESFHCRQFWLKKGYHFVQAGRKFSDESAVVDLGVGKNMVTSIRYWMKAFGLLDGTEKLTPFANNIFGDHGWDPYLEDEGTLWLLHYRATKLGFASIFNLLFNELRKTRPEFSIKHFCSLAAGYGTFSEATLTKDFNAFKNTYVISSTAKSDIEDTYSGLLTEIGLVSLKKSADKNDLLVIEGRRRLNLNPTILLYSIMDMNPTGNSIGFESLFDEPGSIGSIFALNREGLTEKLEEIAKSYPGVTFKNDAGIRELQFRRRPNPDTVLAQYYAR